MHCHAQQHDWGGKTDGGGLGGGWGEALPCIVLTAAELGGRTGKAAGGLNTFMHSSVAACTQILPVCKPVADSAPPCNLILQPPPTGDAPRWVYLLTALSVVAYVNLDCMDGKQVGNRHGWEAGRCWATAG